MLNTLINRGERIYSAAYIMPPPRLGFERKHQNHLALVTLMMRNGLPAAVAGSRSLREVYDQIKPYPGAWPFLGVSVRD